MSNGELSKHVHTCVYRIVPKRLGMCSCLRARQRIPATSPGKQQHFVSHCVASSALGTCGTAVGSLCGSALAPRKEPWVWKRMLWKVCSSILFLLVYLVSASLFLWAACPCLKVFGSDNLISASPFLASLSTCWLPCVTLLVLHPSVKNLLTKCININHYDFMCIGILFPAFWKS